MTAESSGPERWAPGVPGEVAGAEGALADLAGLGAVVTQMR